MEVTVGIEAGDEPEGDVGVLIEGHEVDVATVEAAPIKPLRFGVSGAARIIVEIDRLPIGQLVRAIRRVGRCASLGEERAALRARERAYPTRSDGRGAGRVT